MHAAVHGDLDEVVRLIQSNKCRVAWLAQLPPNSAIMLPPDVINEGPARVLEVLAHGTLPLPSRG